MLHELGIVKRVPLLTPVVGEAAGRTCPPQMFVRKVRLQRPMSWFLNDDFIGGNDWTDNHIIHHRVKADRKRVNNVKTAV